MDQGLGPLDILRQCVHSTGRSQLLLAIPTLLLGGFLVSAESLGIDPASFGGMTAVGTAAVYVMGVGALLFGVWLVYSWRIRTPKKGRAFLDCLANNPDRIRRISYRVYPNGGLHVTVRFRDSGKLQLGVKGAFASTVSEYFAQRVPDALR